MKLSKPARERVESLADDVLDVVDASLDKLGPKKEKLALLRRLEEAIANAIHYTENNA